MTNANTNYMKWLNTYIDEKGLNRDKNFMVLGLSGTNLIPFEVVVEHIAIAPAHEKEAIKKMLVKIDFLNGDAMNYFEHLAKCIAK